MTLYFSFSRVGFNQSLRVLNLTFFIHVSKEFPETARAGIGEVFRACSLFYDRSPYHLETSPLTCRANQWTVFYMIGTSIMKELNIVNHFCKNLSIIDV